MSRYGCTPELVAVDFACNDPDNGDFAGRAGIASVLGNDLELDPYGGVAFTEGGGWIRIHRRKFKFRDSRAWNGNWCWNRYWLPRREYHAGRPDRARGRIPSRHRPPHGPCAEPDQARRRGEVQEQPAGRRRHAAIRRRSRMIPSNDLLRPDNQEVRAQHANWAERHARLISGPPPAEKPERPRPVSPFVREARERRQAQREAFERQMLNAKAGIETHVVHVDRGWPPYTPPLPYDHCGPSLPRGERITMREIIKQVAAKHGVTVNDIISERRPKPVVKARHEAMWRCKQETTNSLPQIGRAFGGRDHTTVLSAVRKHEWRMANGEI